MWMKYGFAVKKDRGEDNALYFNQVAIFFLHIVVSYFIKISSRLPNPVSMIFLNVANSKSDLSFSIRDM